MGVVSASADCVKLDDELAELEVPAVDKALDVLRKSSAEAPVVDMSEVTYICSRTIGLLVTLWVDLSQQGRWFDLVASDKVWSTLDKAGVARVFFQRPKGPDEA